MGSCISSESNHSVHLHHKRYANLVTLAGDLRQYPVPITASQVLDYESCSPQSFFVCSSDGLDFDNFIPSLDLEDQLEAEQIYFVLPVSKLKSRLAASDMAALAVKASVAMNSKRRGGGSRARISPVLIKEEDTVVVSSGVKSTTAAISRSRSGKRMKRYGSRRTKLGRMSFKIRLTTINEGSVLVN